MLTLWTRVAQVRGSCRCPQCISAAQGVARNTTTSAARRPQYWTSSTLWYSGIFAAAATWDAMFKVQRREKWDKAIAEIKQELDDCDGFEADLILQAQARKEAERGRAKYGYTLHELSFNGNDGSRANMGSRMSQGQGHEETVGNVAVLGGDAAFEELATHGDASKRKKRKARSRQPGVEVENGDTTTLLRDEAVLDQNWDETDGVEVFEGDEALQALAANLDSSSKRRSRPKWPTNTGSDTNPKWLPPQSIYAPDWFKRRHELRGWGKYKTERCMLSTDLFLLHTWNELRKKGLSEEASKAVPGAYAKYLMMSEDEMNRNIAQKESDLDLLERLGTKRYDQGQFRRIQEDIPLCGYHVDGEGDFHDTTRRLNQSLRELVQQTESGAHTIPAFLAKVCYHLSLSTAPPNIDTYNTLLVGLFNFRQVKHTENVIHSLLRTRARPNEVTLATVLNFHTATSDVDNFKWWVQRMRGKFGGLMNASPHTTISPLTKNRLIHHENGKNDGLGVIVQLPYPTPMVFGALIKGVLNFSGFESALKICESMAHEGWSLCISGLGTMLQDCTERKDWNSGLTVWKQIQALKWKSARYTSSKWSSETVGLQTFISMLQLCCRCGQRSVFEDVMDQALQAHPKAVDQIIEFVQTDKPAASKLVMSGKEDLVSLDAVAPAWKHPVKETSEPVQSSMDDGFSLETAGRNEVDVATEECNQDAVLDELQNSSKEGSCSPLLTGEGT